MQAKRPGALFLGVVPLLGTAGWLRSHDAVPIRPHQATARGLDLAHDAGEVLEGTQIEHTFQTRNLFPVPIAIVDQADVQKNCGCLTLSPSVGRLAPGEVATIRLRVDTTGKRGPFRVGGVVRWQLEGGDAWPVAVRIEGNATTILTSQPAVVDFSESDIAACSKQELLILSTHEVNWSTLNVQINPPYATVVEKSVEPGRLRLILQACPPVDVPEFSATLQLRAELAELNSGVTRCAVSVPLQASQKVGVHISPRVVFAKWSRELNRGTTQFLVHGLTHASPELISSISCDGLRVNWAASKVSQKDATSHGILQVRLDLASMENRAFNIEQARPMSVHFKSGKVLDVPVYLIAPKDRG